MIRKFKSCKCIANTIFLATHITVIRDTPVENHQARIKPVGYLTKPPMGHHIFKNHYYRMYNTFLMGEKDCNIFILTASKKFLCV